MKWHIVRFNSHGENAGVVSATSKQQAENKAQRWTNKHGRRTYYYCVSRNGPYHHKTYTCEPNGA